MAGINAIDDQTSVFRLLEHRGVRVARFAEHIGYSYDYVHSIRIGRRPISDEFRRRCVAYFQMPEELLFFAVAETQAAATSTRGTAPENPPASPSPFSTHDQYGDGGDLEESHSGASQGESPEE